MPKESILILGGGIMQIPAIESAKALGYRVVVADINRNAPGIRLADCYTCIDLKDHHAMADEAVRLRKEEGLAAVFTAGTDFSATVAYAAAAAGLPGIDYTAALSASNKIQMRGVFERAGVPSPRFVPVRSRAETFEACGKLDFPVVIKPVDSMGARGVVKIASRDDRSSIISAFEGAAAVSRSSEVIVEEFIDGPEFSLDALVYNGVITICGFADRHIFFPPYFIEMGHTIPTSAPESVQKEVIDVFCAGIRALGINNGAAKGDIKYSSRGGAMVGEIAARLSGGFMSGWTFPFSSGINLTSAALQIAAGSPPGNLQPVINKVSAERAVLSIPGVVKSIEGAGEAEKIPGVMEVFLHTSPGEIVVFPVNNVQKCANCISVGDDYNQAAASAEDAVRSIFIHLEPGISTTADFLQSKTMQWAPDAFRVERPADIAELERAEKEGGAAVLPEIDKETSRDWHGLRIKDAMDFVTGYIKCSTRELTYDFYRSFLRGGTQGGVWYIETMRSKRADEAEK